MTEIYVRAQICPIPASLATQAEKVFLEQGSKFNYDFEEVSDPSTFHSRAAGPGGDGEERTEYFKVDLPGGKSLVHWIKPGTPFSLQFGRYDSPSPPPLSNLSHSLLIACSLTSRPVIVRRWRFCSTRRTAQTGSGAPSPTLRRRRTRSGSSRRSRALTRVRR